MIMESMLFLQLLPYLFLSVLMRFIISDKQRYLAKFLTGISVLAGMLVAIWLFIAVGLEGRVIYQELMPWFSITGITVSWGIYIDSLSSLMLLVVSSVSAVVHLYSFGYMHDDKALHRFISYLALFTFFMLLLVVSNNLLQLFVGWEGVGLCSYLLIGFWYKKESACAAANKAFIVNRVGDLALIVGISGLLYFTGSIEFDVIFSKAVTLNGYVMQVLGSEIKVIEFICFMLLFGAMGKSAQIGLHVWLPDAMEGPTPVSALIHAATMVTAGVFLIARCSPLFEYAYAVKMVAMLVGGITCLFAAITAIGQNDIKKIIAYSTCSQLGYMFLACGVGAYGAAMFHLFTHAFFKALLFLCAGNIIHAAHHEQDIRKLYIKPRQMPQTYMMMWIGSIALCGIYPLAGYYSKDLILESVYFNDHFLARGMLYVGLVAAFFTAAYSAKIIISVFHTPKLMEYSDEVHEVGYSMNLPLALLVFGSLFSGIIAARFWHIGSLEGYFQNSIAVLQAEQGHPELDLFITYAPLCVAIAGMVLGVVIYKLRLNETAYRVCGIFGKLSSHKFYFDEIYHYCFVRVMRCIARLAAIFDQDCIDRCGPGGLVNCSSSLSSVIRKLQTGFIFHYAFVMVAGILLALWWILNMFYSL